MADPPVLGTSPVIGCKHEGCLTSVLVVGLDPLPEVSDHGIRSVGRIQIVVIVSIVCEIVCFARSDLHQSGALPFYVFESKVMGEHVQANR